MSHKALSRSALPQVLLKYRIEPSLLRVNGTAVPSDITLRPYRYSPSQKQHWIGWLREYTGPGYYGRKNRHQSAEFVYNHIVCPPMVLWLGEVTGVQRDESLEAKRAALSVGPSLPALSAAIREKHFLGKD